MYVNYHLSSLFLVFCLGGQASSRGFFYFFFLRIVARGCACCSLALCGLFARVVFWSRGRNDSGDVLEQLSLDAARLQLVCEAFRVSFSLGVCTNHLLHPRIGGTLIANWAYMGGFSNWMRFLLLGTRE